MKNNKINNNESLAEFMKMIAFKLKLYRETAGLSQSELARRAKVSKATISDLESGQSKDLQFSTICLIATALNKWPVEFLVKSEYSLTSAGKKEFMKAYDELNEALAIFRPIYKQFKDED